MFKLRTQLLPSFLTTFRKRAVGMLKKIGAFVRRSARQSLRKRKAASAPGSPPSVHTPYLKNKILFAVDTSGLSVVIGPTPDRGNDAEELEYGGVTRRNGKGRSAGRSQRIEARPFMRPALAKNLTQIGQIIGG